MASNYIVLLVSYKDAAAVPERVVGFLNRAVGGFYFLESNKGVSKNPLVGSNVGEPLGHYRGRPRH